VHRYDPDTAPSQAEWLAFDEQARIDLAIAYHHRAKVRVPNLRAHGAIHAIVENQIAMGLEAAARALGRLQGEGLSRHDCIHAIGSVLAEHLFDISKQENTDDAHTVNARYAAALERLSAKQWLKDYGPK